MSLHTYSCEQVQFPEEYRAAFVNSLSGGWKMRMSVAISIMHEPELLLLDQIPRDYPRCEIVRD